MSTTTETTSETFQDFLSRYNETIASMDVDRIVANHDPDIIAYDAIAQLEFKGAAYTAHWRACMELCQNMVFEAENPVVHISGDTAVAHYLVRCGGTGPDGQTQTGWMRATVVGRHIDGRWLLVHEHYSSPFDPMSLKILTDIEPAG